jgi:probable F420-dependent oxidoreductase
MVAEPRTNRGSGSCDRVSWPEMKLGLNLSPARPDHVCELAVLAESLGYDAVFVPEHVLVPVHLDDPYPGTDDGSLPWPATAPLYDPFVQLTRISEQTETIQLGTAVHVLGLRHPIETARIVASLDVLSGGRMLLGVGVGWLRQEFRELGIEPADRFARLEEAIEALRALWTMQRVEFRGEHFEFGPLFFEPKPSSRPHPPVLMAGDSPAALRRAARCADGWISGGTLTSVKEVTDALEAIRVHRATLERDCSFQVNVLVPDPDDSFVEGLAALGVDRLVVAPWRRSRDAAQGIADLAARVARLLG